MKSFSRMETVFVYLRVMMRNILRHDPYFINYIVEVSNASRTVSSELSSGYWEPLMQTSEGGMRQEGINEDENYFLHKSNTQIVRY